MLKLKNLIEKYRIKLYYLIGYNFHESSDNNLLYTIRLRNKDSNIIYKNFDRKNNIIIFESIEFIKLNNSGNLEINKRNLYVILKEKWSSFGIKFENESYFSIDNNEEIKITVWGIKDNNYITGYLKFIKE